MTDIELLKKARNGDNNAKSELLDNYYRVIEKFAKEGFIALNEQVKQALDINNIFFIIDRRIVDETDVIDEYMLQASEILNSFLPFKYENRFDIFLNEELSKYSKKFVLEKTKEIISIMRKDPIGLEKIQEIPANDNSFNIFNFPFYREKIDLTIDETFNFLSKYYAISREEIANAIFFRIVYIINFLKLDDKDFNQKFLVELEDTKIDYVKNLLQINIDKITSLEALWLKKLETSNISEISYYCNLVLECAKETYKELIKYMYIDFESICVEFFGYFNHKVREYFQTGKNIKLSDFDDRFTKWLHDKKDAFIYGTVLKIDIDFISSSDHPNKPFHN